MLEAKNQINEPGIQEKETLLAMALKYQDKTQWSAGESVWLWRNGKRGAFLKEQQGFIHLCLVGLADSVCIFWFNPTPWRWEVAPNVETRYQQWVNRIRRSAK